MAVAGCVAQQEGQKLLDRYRELDLVFGPDAVPRVRELVAAARPVAGGRAGQVLDTEFLDLETYAFATDLDPDADGKVGAFVTIQKGCDNKCTFCIVPATRGLEVSRPSDQIHLGSYSRKALPPSPQRRRDLESGPERLLPPAPEC